MENDRSHLKYPLEHLPETNYWLYALQATRHPFSFFGVGGSVRVICITDIPRER